jgi:hypothetical protein
MAETQVLIKNIPVLKTGIFIATVSAIIIGILGVIVGLILLLFGRFVEALEVIILAPIITAILTFIMGTIIAFGMRKGLSACGGFPLFIESEKGEILVKSLSVVKSAIYKAVVLGIIAIPFALLIALIGLASGSVFKSATFNPIAALIIVIVLPILAMIFGFIAGVIETVGKNAGFSLAGGLPIKVESEQNSITIRGIDAFKLAIVNGIEFFVGGVVLAFLLLLVSLVIPTDLSTLPATYSNAIAAVKGVLLLAIVALPIVMLIWGFVCGAFAAIGINAGLNAINGLKIESDVKSAKIVFNRVDIGQATIAFAAFYAIAAIPSIGLQSLIAMISNVFYGVLMFIIGVVEYLIIGAIMGLACAFGFNSLKGYDVDGENLDKLFGSG